MDADRGIATRSSLFFALQKIRLDGVNSASGGHDGRIFVRPCSWAWFPYESAPHSVNWGGRSVTENLIRAFASATQNY